MIFNSSRHRILLHLRMNFNSCEPDVDLHTSFCYCSAGKPQTKYTKHSGNRVSVHKTAANEASTFLDTPSGQPIPPQPVQNVVFTITGGSRGTSAPLEASSHTHSSEPELDANSTHTRCLQKHTLGSKHSSERTPIFADESAFHGGNITADAIILTDLVRQQKKLSVVEHESGSMFSPATRTRSSSHLDEEVPRSEPRLPRHPSLIHRLQVLQGGEGGRGSELLDGRIRCRARKDRKG